MLYIITNFKLIKYIVQYISFLNKTFFNKIYYEKSILQFPNHIDDALQIENNFFTDKVNYNSVIISGQGGSAIGGFLIYDLLDFKIVQHH